MTMTPSIATAANAVADSLWGADRAAPPPPLDPDALVHHAGVTLAPITVEKAPTRASLTPVVRINLATGHIVGDASSALHVFRGLYVFSVSSRDPRTGQRLYEDGAFIALWSERTQWRSVGLCVPLAELRTLKGTPEQIAQVLAQLG